MNTAADERETVALMRAGERRGAAPMRTRAVDKALRGGPLTHGQREAVKLIVSARGGTVGVQGNAGTGKDHHAQARPRAAGKEGMHSPRPRALGPGRPHA